MDKELEIKDITEENIDYSYEDLLEQYEYEFNSTIKYRGKNYYEQRNVVNCYKAGKNKFIGFVKGSQLKPYKVKIEIDDDEINMECTCPCDFPCKHEYAVLKAISNYEFSEIELKPEIKNINDNLKKIVEKIPAEEIKKYILSPEHENYVVFEMEKFENYFKKYLPKQSYEYYYNNLYNTLVVDECFEEKTDSYLDEIKKYIKAFEFEEAFKIVRAIINAFIDSKRIGDNEYLVEKMPMIGMYIRVINRKANEELKKKIFEWITYLEQNNYFDNLYLEDAIEISK